MVQCDILVYVSDWYNVTVKSMYLIGTMWHFSLCIWLVLCDSLVYISDWYNVKSACGLLPDNARWVNGYCVCDMGTMAIRY